MAEESTCPLENERLSHLFVGDKILLTKHSRFLIREDLRQPFAGKMPKVCENEIGHATPQKGCFLMKTGTSSEGSISAFNIEEEADRVNGVYPVF